MMTRKILIFLATLFAIWTISLMDKDANAQSKKLDQVKGKATHKTR